MDFLLWFTGISVLIIGGSMIYRSSKSRREYLVYAVVNRIRLPVTEDIVMNIDRRVWNRFAGFGLGWIASLLFLIPFFVKNPALVPSGVAGYAVGSIAIAVGTASAALVAVRQFAEPGPDASRVARARSHSLFDYVHPGWVWAAVTAAGVATAAGATLLLGSRRPDADIGLPLPAVVSLAAIALIGVPVVALLCRALLAVPQPASSELELQWDDALRASALRDLWIASIALSTAALVTAASWLVGPAPIEVYAVCVIGYLPIVLTALPASRRTNRRLWPLPERATH
ncbi:hypothetical protein [Leifsonia sp. A12D58]|uniref:hypothetical protein n=1 Tax=Leifsonia sp. A12D58 TaxID=3397674 RepID=UPI0039E0A641